ncbi:MAG: hypothetical protein KIT84_10960 [Labilithrix sp.]|nr:hypothetical protein [Labilithrix sp.]MCW5811527.1 hypothetical protein [Labilithrix sp.]
MDLFTPVVSVDLQHQNFRRLTSEGREPERDVLRRWATDFPDRDGKFVKEFQTTFNSCFWELYLHATFRASGLTLDFTKAAPDFSVDSGATAFTAEAAIASHAAGFAAEWEVDPAEELSPERKRAVLDYASIRLANAFDGKLRKFRTSYSRFDHVAGKPFVVCLAPFEQPYSYLLAERGLRRLLYAFDLPVFVDDDVTGKRVIVGSSTPERVWKSSTADVPFGLFTDARASEVSAVIYSSVATFGKVQALSESTRPAVFTAVRYNATGTQPFLIHAPRDHYEEGLLDGLHVFLNPYAAIAFDPSIFDPREVAIHHGFDDELGIVRTSMPHGFLFSRTVMTFGPTDPAKHGPSPAGSRGKLAELEPWPEGELRPIGGSFTAYSKIHLAHYAGWTILVAHDRFDDEWGAQATRGVYKDLFAYMQGSKGDPDSFMAPGFFASRDEAFSAMKNEIDELPKKA